ncbi:MAG: PepSY domain-containing protein [Steroidobacterales bacterium]
MPAAADAQGAVVLAQSGGGSREISREQAVALVQQRFNARVVRVDVLDSNGRRVYVLRLLSDGGSKVQTVRVDAATGSIQ